MIKEGARLQLEGFRGTIRYIGKLEGVSGEWLGVEWDDASRGKHRGDYLGRSYFQCHPTKTGSFIKISDKICFGNDFMKMVTERYGLLSGKTLEKLATDGRQISIYVPEIHEDEEIRRKLGDLSEISIRERCAGFSGNSEEIRICLGSE